jgi:acyl phosphate:glycerol-3-phosphate acyltransferase
VTAVEPVLPDLLRIAAALLVGYALGSLPISAWVGRAAGVDLTRDGEATPGSANVWKLAGPGPGMLALTGDLARGVLPVALGLATFSWWTGWVAGVAALAGACWPAFGRWRGGRGVATLAGVCLALAPAAGVIGIALTAALALGARAAGRNARVAAIALGFATFPVLFLAEHADLARLAGLGLLYLVALARYATTRR